MSPYLGPSGVSVTFSFAIRGFPGISVPAGYDSKRVPIGICFGLKGSEPKLIEIAYGLQATKIRKPPSFELAMVGNLVNLFFV